MTSIESLIADIQHSLAVSDARLVQALMTGSRLERFSFSWQLATTLARHGEKRQSRLLAQRAFALWNGEPGFIDEYLAMLSADQNIEGIREACKRAGMWMAEHGNLVEALRYFNLHQYAYPSAGQGDRYEYDLDILRTVEQLATGVGLDRKPRKKRKIRKSLSLRVAYLVFGATHVNSVLIRLMADFARFHDRSQVECLFFSPDINYESQKVNAELLRVAGGDLITVNSADEETCLIETQKMLRDCRPDVLVSVAALADYRQYYLFCSCPSAVRIALAYGPPAQYVPPIADFVISATWHPLIDSPCDGAVVEIEATLPERPSIPINLPESIDLPHASIVLMAAGRSEKFLDRDYWKTILEVLRLHPKTCFVAYGLVSRPPFLEELLTEDVRDKVYIFGWLENYQGLLARASIMIDTYPSGGGLTILDAMSFAIPVVSFKNDYLQTFDQVTWNPAEELIGPQELIVPRGDFAELTRLLTDLIENSALRERLGQECKLHVAQTRSQPERMIRRIENIYFDVMEGMRSQGEDAWTATDSLKEIFTSFGPGFRQKSAIRLKAQFYWGRAQYITQRLFQKISSYIHE